MELNFDSQGWKIAFANPNERHVNSSMRKAKLDMVCA